MFGFILTSCTSGGNGKNETKDTTKIVKDTLPKVVVKKEPVKIAFDQNLTNVARFIAGLEVKKDTQLINIQKKDYYKKHIKFVKETWSQVEKKHLKPVRKWVKDEKIVENKDTATLLYPFSGPDFLYGSTFYPNCRTYILAALEPQGTVPNFKAMKDKNIANYLLGIEHSLKYLNKVGYFVTQHMGSDFSKLYLNGNLHMICYFLARTNHKLIDVSTVYLNEKGEPIVYTDKKQAGKNIKALRIQFTDEKQSVKKELYYYSLDVSDANMKRKPQFFKFLDRYPKKFAYMKSASYILLNSTFKSLRDYILNNASKILQDDTGVPYKYFDNTKFDVKLYGVYTGVIKQLKYAFQPDLKKAIDALPKKQLPFHISYNAWHKEGMLIYAKRKH